MGGGGGRRKKQKQKKKKRELEGCGFVRSVRSFKGEREREREKEEQEAKVGQAALHILLTNQPLLAVLR